MRLRFPTIGAALLLLGCACANSGGVATQQTAEPVYSPPSPPLASPSWHFALKAGWDVSQVRANHDSVIVGGRSGVFALDPATGRPRWQRNDGASAIRLDEYAVFYGTRSGAIVSRRVHDGSVRWQRDGVCPAPSHGIASGGADVILGGETDLLVGCSGGRVVRVDRASGRILAMSTDFSVDQIASITSLGSCSYGVEGWSSGATIVQHAEILGCKRLNQILGEQNETPIVGSIGNVAILDDRCCFGRAGVYRPATISRVNLLTGDRSPAVDLAPEPYRYPPGQRPIGQGSIAFLAGNELYLAVDHALYLYGDPRDPRPSAKRVADNFVEPPAVLGNDRLAMRLRGPNATTWDEIARLRDDAFATIFRIREDPTLPYFFLSVAGNPDVLSLARAGGASTFVRADDGSQLTIDGGGQPVAASKELLVLLRSTNVLVGNRYQQYIAGYRWLK